MLCNSLKYFAPEMFIILLLSQYIWIKKPFSHRDASLLESDVRDQHNVDRCLAMAERGPV